MITDEMVEKALVMFLETYGDDGVLQMDAMRVALEAVAPALIAQGMREAADILSTYNIPTHDVVGPLMLAATNAMHIRAQELDPK